MSSGGRTTSAQTPEASLCSSQGLSYDSARRYSSFTPSISSNDTMKSAGGQAWNNPNNNWNMYSGLLSDTNVWRTLETSNDHKLAQMNATQQQELGQKQPSAIQLSAYRNFAQPESIKTGRLGATDNPLESVNNNIQMNRTNSDNLQRNGHYSSYSPVNGGNAYQNKFAQMNSANSAYGYVNDNNQFVKNDPADNFPSQGAYATWLSNQSQPNMMNGQGNQSQQRKELSTAYHVNSQNQTAGTRSSNFSAAYGSSKSGPAWASHGNDHIIGSILSHAASDTDGLTKATSSLNIGKEQQQTLKSSGSENECTDPIELKVKLQLKDTIIRKLQADLELARNQAKKFAGMETKNGKHVYEIPKNHEQLYERLVEKLQSTDKELEETKARLESLATAVTLNPSQSQYKYGRYDEQEVAHKIITKLQMLTEENEEMSKMLSYGKAKEKDIEIGLLKSQNEQLRQKLEKLEAKKEESKN